MRRLQRKRQENGVVRPSRSPNVAVEMQMRRDTHLTFKDIHGNPEAMFENIQLVQNTALSRDAVNWPSLRFLSLAGSQVASENIRNQVYLHRMPSSPAPEEYVAISYVWQRPDVSKERIPEYHIVSADGQVTRLSAELNYVMHRVVQFALSKNLNLIWIDKLCIDQEDPADVERHLLCMHKVYEQSDYVFVPLVSYIDDEKTLSHLRKLADHESDSQGSLPSISVEELLELLRLITRDCWFTRTWTYQERHCGRKTILELHVDASIASTSIVHKRIAIGMDKIRRIYKTVLQSAPTWHMKKKDSQSTVLAELESMMCLNFDYPQISRTTDELDMTLARRSFHIMEQCENAVVSDRIAIMANVGNYIYRLRSRLLNNEQFSYSTCTLVLLLSNGWLALRASNDYFFNLRMDATILDIMDDVAIINFDDPDRSVFVPDFRKSIYISHNAVAARLPETHVRIPVLTIEEMNSLAMRNRDDVGDIHDGLTRVLTRHESHAGLVHDDILRWALQRRQMRAMEEADS